MSMSSKGEGRLSLDKMPRLLEVIDQRIMVCKKQIADTKCGLNLLGTPASTPSSLAVIRAKAVRDMQLLYLVRDLLVRQESNGGIQLSAPGRAGMEKLLFPLRKHIADAQDEEVV
jgi:hypothetical protein